MSADFYCYYKCIPILTHLHLLPLLHLLQAKYVTWTLTYSPEVDTEGCPENIMQFVTKHAKKYYMVQELADKKHIQCAFLTQKGYSRSWGNKVRKDLGYTNTELRIHVHNDFLGAIGYQDGEVIANSGFSEQEISAAREYYKNRVNMKYYRDHVKTMVQLSLAQVNPIRDHIMAKEHVDEYTAENIMVNGGFIWPYMKTTDPYVNNCKLRDSLHEGEHGGSS